MEISRSQISNGIGGDNSKFGTQKSAMRKKCKKKLKKKVVKKSLEGRMFLVGNIACALKKNLTEQNWVHRSNPEEELRKTMLHFGTELLT